VAATRFPTSHCPRSPRAMDATHATRLCHLQGFGAAERDGAHVGGSSQPSLPHADPASRESGMTRHPRHGDQSRVRAAAPDEQGQKATAGRPQHAGGNPRAADRPARGHQDGERRERLRRVWVWVDWRADRGHAADIVPLPTVGNRRPLGRNGGPTDLSCGWAAAGWRVLAAAGYHRVND